MVEVVQHLATREVIAAIALAMGARRQTIMRARDALSQ
jgi:hypothetical protein